MCIGVLLLVLGLWIPRMQSVWNYMSVTGTIYLSGAIVTIVGGLYWRRASSKGAVAALLCGLLGVAGLVPEAEVPAIKERLPEWLKAPAVGLAVFGCCAIVFVVVSLLCPDPPRPEPGKD